ncbi:MAG: amidohydrolase family protein [Acidobacteria bacterium]|nr:amidohydrolase family protein [Acidobacteriota bacterium]MCA1640968.1 amidohydrolase family protein [Acidobacteriota bacterium]
MKHPTRVKVFARAISLSRDFTSRAALLCVAFALTVVAASAQQASSNMGPAFLSGTPGTYAIRGAHVYPVSAPDIENGTVVIANGKIAAVGASVSVPSGARVIDGRGLSVYPGMIDLGTSMGLIEITEQGATGWVDTQEVGELNPNARAFYGINPHSAHVAVTRVNGVTTVLSSPQGGLVSGQAALVNLLGATAPEMAVERTAALVVNYPRSGGGFGGGFFVVQQQPGAAADAATQRDRQVEQIRKLLRDAEAYGRALDAANADARLPRPDRDVVLESLVPYVRGLRPVVFRADREADIRAAIRFAEEMKLKPVILGANDAWKMAAFLKEHNVPVVIAGVLDLPNREDDAYDLMYENASKLQAAGVQFAISTGDTAANVRDLPYHAGMASAFGLPRDAALRAVTLTPAQIIGAGSQLGSLDVGKIANVVVTDGDLLEARTNIRHLFINGRDVPLVSKHTELYNQFKDRK